MENETEAWRACGVGYVGLSGKFRVYWYLLTDSQL